LRRNAVALKIHKRIDTKNPWDGSLQVSYCMVQNQLIVAQRHVPN
jgi:hypothetical protein